MAKGNLVPFNPTLRIGEYNMRIVYNMDMAWQFHRGDLPEDNAVVNSHTASYASCKAGVGDSAAKKEFADRDWRTVDLPHDYFCESEVGPDNLLSHGYRERDNAWYRKSFVLDESLKDKSLTLCFEGTAVNAEFYFNGSLMARSFSAYTETTFDITDRAYFDGTPNVLAVRILGFATEGWWYEGAGIYRHVKLYVTEKMHIAHNGIYAKPVLKEGTKNSWYVDVATTLENGDYDYSSAQVRATLYDGETPIAEKISKEVSVDGYMQEDANVRLSVSRPVRWDSDHVTIINDETLDLTKEIVRCDALDRVHIGLDYFDASINRIGAYVIGSRATQKCLLQALLEPLTTLRQYEAEGKGFERLALLEECKSLPWNAVWDMFCLKNNVPVGEDYIANIQKYEQEVTSKRA